MITPIPGKDPDGTWAGLETLIEAVYNRDLLVHLDRWVTLGESTDHDDQVRLALWLSFLVHGAAVMVLHSPADARSLGQLADSLSDDFAFFIREDEGSLLDLLQTVFGQAEDGRLVTGARFILNGSVVAGLLMAELAQPPNRFLPGLQTWCRAHADDIEKAVRGTE